MITDTTHTIYYRGHWLRARPLLPNYVPVLANSVCRLRGRSAIPTTEVTRLRSGKTAF